MVEPREEMHRTVHIILIGSGGVTAAKDMLQPFLIGADIGGYSYV